MDDLGLAKLENHVIGDGNCPNKLYAFSFTSEGNEIFEDVYLDAHESIGVSNQIVCNENYLMKLLLHAACLKL